VGSIDASGAGRLGFVRHGGCVAGPFPRRAIRDDWLVGRLPADAEVTSNRIDWTRVASLSDPIPAPAAGADDWAGERAEAARRWADSRGGIDRRRADGGAAHPPRRKGGERRSARPLVRRSIARGRPPIVVVDRRAWLRLWIAGGVVALLLAVAGAVCGPVQPAVVDLGVHARPAQ
jgi:hypothetical protein